MDRHADAMVFLALLLQTKGSAWTSGPFSALGGVVLVAVLYYLIHLTLDVLSRFLPLSIRRAPLLLFVFASLYRFLEAMRSAP